MMEGYERSGGMKRWLLKRTKIDTAAMARDLGIRRATAAVLANRELSSRQAARNFLYGGTAALGNIPALLSLAPKAGLMVVKHYNRHALFLRKRNFLQRRNAVIAGKKRFYAFCRKLLHCL